MAQLTFGDKRLTANGSYITKQPIKYFPLLNGGADGTTDWINPTSGLAENWGVSSTPWASGTIVNGNGFNGNAQRMDVTTASVRLIHTATLSTPQDITSLNGVISFKYRCNGSFNCRMFSDLSVTGGPTISSNIGNAMTHNQNISIGSGNYLVGIDFLTTAGIWIVIDEVSITLN